MTAVHICTITRTHIRMNSSYRQNKHPFNGFFSKTTWVSRQQKGKTILDFNEARDNEVAVASAGPYANHLHLAPDRQPRSSYRQLLI